MSRRSVPLSRITEVTDPDEITWSEPTYCMECRKPFKVGDYMFSGPEEDDPSLCMTCSSDYFDRNTELVKGWSGRLEANIFKSAGPLSVRDAIIIEQAFARLKELAPRYQVRIKTDGPLWATDTAGRWGIGLKFLCRDLAPLRKGDLQ